MREGREEYTQVDGWSANFLLCAQVKYFKQRRVMEWKKQKTYERLAAEGAEGMPEGMAIPSGLPTQSSRTSK